MWFRRPLTLTDDLLDKACELDPLTGVSLEPEICADERIFRGAVGSLAVTIGQTMGLIRRGQGEMDDIDGMGV